MLGNVVFPQYHLGDTYTKFFCQPGHLDLVPFKHKSGWAKALALTVQQTWKLKEGKEG